MTHDHDRPSGRPSPPPKRAERRDLAALAAEIRAQSRGIPDSLAQRFAQLTVREQAEIALLVPAEQRLDLLLHSTKPMRLVRALPDSEFYLTVREVGPSDALPVASLASPSQLEHLLDLESWRQDRFDGDRAGAWVALLLEAGEPCLRRFLRAVDDEYLALLFQRWLRVKPVELEDDPDIKGAGETEAGDERGLATPDGNHRFSPTIPEHAAAARLVLALLFHEQPARYQRVLLASVWELPAELEEEALRWRQSRLEEHGFPPWEEALQVYAPPSGVAAHPAPPPPTDPDGLPASRSPLRVLEGPDPLTRVLDGLSPQTLERVLHEALALGNHLLVADRADTGDPRAHREALRKGTGYISIALEAGGALAPEQVRPLVEQRPLVELFREGYARATDLQGQARRLLRDGWAAAHPRALELLDSPISEQVHGLLELRPMYFEPGSEDRRAVWRGFRSLSEIVETRVALEMAECVGQVMVQHLGLDVAQVLSASDEHAAPRRFSTLLLTLLAWHATRGELRGDPLPADATADFLRDFASRRTAAPDAAGGALESLTSALNETFGLSARDHSLLLGFGRACLERLSSECGGLDPGVPPDPRSVACLLLGG